jgi:hypothetical protein
MMRRPLLLALAAILGLAPAAAQDPALKDGLQAAKALWAAQGDRDGATTRFESLLAALEPKARILDEGGIRMLCEVYNWLAVLDDRSPGRQAQATRRLESLLELDPDFEIDRAVTNRRLQTAFDNLRAAKYCKVKVSLDPAGGALTLDGKVRRAEAGFHHLPPGTHVMTYGRPGFKGQEQRFDLAPKDARNVDFKLIRTSSVITLYTSPVGAEILVDGTSRGATRGQVPVESSFLADRIGVHPDQLSQGFPIVDLAPGKHLVEVRLPCFRTRRLEIGEALTTPFADHDLEPVKLEASRATLTVTSAVPGGELFLSGQDMGRVPVQDLPVCAQAYDLQVKYPAGSFTQRVDLPEGKSVTVSARPNPRITYAGFEGTEDFAGRERILGMLASLGNRLRDVAWIPAAAGESVKDCLARARSRGETELLLWARPVPGKPIHRVELILQTLSGEEERTEIKPLENDPLGTFVARTQEPLDLVRPWAGLTLLDLPEGPFVLQADAAAQRAGIKAGLPLTAAAGKPCATCADVQKALAEAKGGQIQVSQGDTTASLAVTPMAVELPVSAQRLCYPLVLARLKLHYLGAQGDEAALLRLQQALALMHFREYDKALDVIRDARMVAVRGVSQGTLDYYTGICLLRMGNLYIQEAIQAFNQALKYPQATLFGPDGPLVAPLARQALLDLHP